MIGRILLLGALAAGPALAQGAHNAGSPPQPAPETLSPAQKAARRWPQPVRVGDLVHRQVFEATPQQPVLGRVAGVVRTGDGGLAMVVDYGGVLGVGARKVAIPVDATTLLGPFVQVNDLSRADVAKLPTFAAAGTTPVGVDEVIRVGIGRN